VRDTVVAMFGSHRARPHRERVMLLSNCGIGLGGYEPSFLALAHLPVDHAIEVLAFV